MQDMNVPPNCFAVVPAAGRGLRMGTTHKLLLPWRKSTVIDHVLGAWASSKVTHILVVVRQDDEELQKVCGRWPTVQTVIPPHNPSDMRHSIQFGLQQISVDCEPNASDRWMVAPADLPTLNSDLINQVIEASRESDKIVVPQFGGRRGHPVSFPWSLVPEVFKLSDDQGVNSLVVGHSVQYLELTTGEHPDDIDTPEDYQRLSNRHKA